MKRDTLSLSRVPAIYLFRGDEITAGTFAGRTVDFVERLRFGDLRINFSDGGYAVCSDRYSVDIIRPVDNAPSI